VAIIVGDRVELAHIERHQADLHGGRSGHGQKSLARTTRALCPFKCAL
jgi:hypothetical protein